MTQIVLKGTDAYAITQRRFSVARVTKKQATAMYIDVRERFLKRQVGVTALEKAGQQLRAASSEWVQADIAQLRAARGDM
jgi:hypothetical protein